MLSFLIVGLTGAMAAYLSATGRAYHHDGLRPIGRRVADGSLSRKAATEYGVRVSYGFFAQLAIPLALLASRINPWILFLPTDLIGLLSSRPLTAAAAGLGWGFAVFAIASVDVFVLSTTEMGVLASFLSIALAFAPVLATFRQFGSCASFLVSVSGFLTLLLLYIVLGETLHSAHAWIYCAVGFSLGAIAAFGYLALKHGKRREAKRSVNSEGSLLGGNHRLVENRVGMIALCFLGGALSMLTSLRVFVGSESAAFLLSITPAAAAVTDILHNLGFVGILSIGSALSGSAPLMGVFWSHLFGYVVADPITAGIVGFIWTGAQLRVGVRVSRFLVRHYEVRLASEHLRGALTTLTTAALILSAVWLAIRYNPWFGAGLGIFFVANELTGVRIMRSAVGVLGLFLMKALWLVSHKV